jgi:hypothetical protein
MDSSSRGSYNALYNSERGYLGARVFVLNKHFRIESTIGSQYIMSYRNCHYIFYPDDYECNDTCQQFVLKMDLLNKSRDYKEILEYISSPRADQLKWKEEE